MPSLEARPSLARRFKAKPELRAVQIAPGSTTVAWVLVPVEMARPKQTNKETYLDGPRTPTIPRFDHTSKQVSKIAPPALLRRSMSCSKKGTPFQAAHFQVLYYIPKLCLLPHLPACLHLLWGHPTHLRMWGWPGWSHWMFNLMCGSLLIQSPPFNGDWFLQLGKSSQRFGHGDKERSLWNGTTSHLNISLSTSGHFLPSSL